MTAIIILNWNGWRDTIECLESLYATHDEFCLVVADNGSTDDSIPQIKTWLEHHDVQHRTLRRYERNTAMLMPKECVVYEIGENLGFARGNNDALAMLGDFVPEYVMLLNNDTVVTDGFLSHLTTFFKTHPEYVALTPRIHYYNPSNLIWNCGGKLQWGSRRYYYAKASVDSITEQEYLDITFVTGCALLAKRELLNAEQHLLTNRFFFGEEDFEFSMRMKQRKHKIACVLDSLIYHKVNASSAQTPTLAKIQLHYVNRVVNMRLSMPCWQFSLWLPVQLTYLAMLLVRQHFGLGEILRILRNIVRDGCRLDEVNYAYFCQLKHR